MRKKRRASAFSVCMGRRFALGAVLAMLCAAAPASATVVPELGAVTTVNASGPSWIPVQLKQPARLDLNSENVVEAKVTGKQTGKWLDRKATGQQVHFSVVIFFPWDLAKKKFKGERVYVVE